MSFFNLIIIFSYCEWRINFAISMSFSFKTLREYLNCHVASIFSEVKFYEREIQDQAICVVLVLWEAFYPGLF